MRKTAALATRTQSEPTTELTTRRETEVPRRRYLTENEVEALIKAVASERDRIMILIAYRHGLRVSELINLQWRQVDFDGAHLQVERLKGGEDSVHPLSGREIRSLRKLRRAQPVGSRFVFTTRDGHPMTRQAFDKMLRQAAGRAGLEDCHAHLLRHGFGAVAQFEREIMLERQREGIAKARAEGRYKGRAPTARAKTTEIKTLRDQGTSAAEIAKRLKVGRASVYRILVA